MSFKAVKKGLFPLLHHSSTPSHQCMPVKQILSGDKQNRFKSVTRFYLEAGSSGAGGEVGREKGPDPVPVFFE